MLETHSGNRLRVAATIEGEYTQDLVVKIEEAANKLLISTDFLPSFTNPNDKLSAHKVISIGLKISLPEQMYVQCYGTNTNVLAKGNYNTLQLALVDGQCTLAHTNGQVKVKTQTGAIYATLAQGQVSAKSNYGQVKKGQILPGSNLVELYSVEGDIFINQN